MKSEPPSSRVARVDAALGRVVRVADRTGEILTSLMLLAVIVFYSVEIFSRTALNTSFAWIYEANLLLVNWVYFIGICLAYHHNRDIVVDVVTKFMGEETKRLYLIGLNIVIVGVLFVVFLYAFPLILVQAETTSFILKFPTHFLSLPVLIGAVTMILIVAKQSTAIWLESGRK